MFRSYHQIVFRMALVAVAGVLVSQVAPDWARADEPAPLSETQQHVVDALELGFTIGPRSLKEAQKHLTALERAQKDDSRVDYLWGLVLMRQSQLKAAATRFESATKRQEGEYQWQARRALVWVRLADRQYEAGLAALTEFARLVRDADTGPEATERQRDAAMWIGQVLESLLKSLTAPKQREQVDDCLDQINEIFAGELRAVLELGRDIIRERELELAHEAVQAKQADEEKAQRKKDADADRLTSDLSDLAKEKESTSRSAEEWKTWLDEALARADKAIGELERDYESLERRRQTIDQSLANIGREVTALQFQGAGTNTPRANALQLDQIYARRQGELLAGQLEYNATVNRMTQVAQRGQALLKERAAITQRYEKATGQLVKKSAELDKWTARIKDKKQKLSVKSAAKAAKTGIDRNVVSFKTYMPFDPGDERARLLESFGIPAELPPAARK